MVEKKIFSVRNDPYCCADQVLVLVLQHSHSGGNIGADYLGTFTYIARVAVGGGCGVSCVCMGVSEYLPSDHALNSLINVYSLSLMPSDDSTH